MRCAFLSPLFLIALAACTSDERYDEVVPQVVAQNHREYIRANVAEPERASAMIALVDRCEALTLELDRAQQAFLAEVERENARPDATDAELRAVLDRALAARERTSDQLFDALLELRATARPAEWERIVQMEADGLGANLRRERRAAFTKGGRS
jgi:hypothetical protein